jgi:predicted Zn-dependent protease with MMP-like domain
VPAAERPGAASGARDRRGRGLRGPLAPAGSPLHRSRAGRFDEQVLDAFERLERRYPRELAAVDVAVEDVPPPAEAGPVRLGDVIGGPGTRPPVLVVYRRAVEARATGPREVEDLLREVLAEQVADLLGLTPEQVDPGYGQG